MRLSILLSLFLAAAGLLVASSTRFYTLACLPGAALWMFGVLNCLRAPAGRLWAGLSLGMSGLGAIVLCVAPFADLRDQGHTLLAGFTLNVASSISAVVFAILVAGAMGRPDLQRQGALLLIVPLVTWVLALFSVWFALAVSILVVFWAAFFSSFLGRVARAVEYAGEPEPETEL